MPISQLMATYKIEISPHEDGESYDIHIVSELGFGHLGGVAGGPDQGVDFGVRHFADASI